MVETMEKLGSVGRQVLFLSNLYPNPEEPERGIFSYQMIEELRALCDVTVVSPLPWFPGWLSSKKLDRWAKFSRVPERVQQDDRWVYYPKYFIVPKVSDSIQGHAIYRGTLPGVARYIPANAHNNMSNTTRGLHISR